MNQKCKIHTVSIDDVNLIKNIYKKKGNVPNSKNNFNITTEGENPNRNVLSGKEYICDLNNTELTDILKKYIEFDDKTEYFSSIHYINYSINQEAKSHVDLPYSYKTYVIILNEDYEGGEFYIENELIPQKIGYMMEYNGDIKHSVKRIKKGNREVLVVWINKSQKNSKSIL